MDDLRQRFAMLDSVPVPDVWSDVERRREVLGGMASTRRLVTVNPARRGAAGAELSPGSTTSTRRRRNAVLLATATLLAALLIGGAIAVGSGLVRVPSIVPPVPRPLSTLTDKPSPSPRSSTPSPSLAGPLGGGLILVHDLPRSGDRSVHDVVALDAGTGARVQLGTLPGSDASSYDFQRNADRDQVLILTNNGDQGVVSNLQAPTDASLPFGFITRRDIDYGSALVLSPRGDLIAGTDDLDHATAIVISGVEHGSQRIPLPPGVSGFLRPPIVVGWSPDQSALLAIGCRPCNTAETAQDRQTPEHQHLYFVPLDGSPWRELLDEDDGYLRASWSPDGSTLAVTDSACPPKTNLPKCDFGPSTMTLVAVADESERSVTTGTERTWMAPVWSTDGRHIAVMGSKVGEELKDGGIYVLDADGSGARKVADTNVTYVPPVWSPDDRWLAFRNDSSTTEWWIVPAAGGEPQPIGNYGGVAW
jgi:dipeptidyl aminopeptidase/acylaminoacyl peptidase